MGLSDLYDCHDEQEPLDHRGPRWSMSTNARGIIVSRVRFYAMPERAEPEWERRERERIGDQDFELAQGETYDVPIGAAYYQMFAERTHEVSRFKFEGYYVREATSFNSNFPLIVGLDGGQERPCAIVEQFDPANCILWSMRELRVRDFQAGEFIALLRFMLGLVTERQLMDEQRSGRWNTARSLDWIQTERREKFYGVQIPWLQPGSGLKIHCIMAKHEALQKSQMARDVELNSLRKLYIQQGIPLNVATEGWDHRDMVAGFLLRDGATQGIPRGVFDPSCKWLIKGLAGGLVQPPPTQRTGGPKRDRVYEDSHDAWLNGACAVFPLRHADRLRQLEAAQARGRVAAAPGQHGLRWMPRQEMPASSWGGMRVNYREESNG